MHLSQASLSDVNDTQPFLHVFLRSERKQLTRTQTQTKSSSIVVLITSLTSSTTSSMVKPSSRCLALALLLVSESWADDRLGSYSSSIPIIRGVAANVVAANIGEPEQQLQLALSKLGVQNS